MKRYRFFEKFPLALKTQVVNLKIPVIELLFHNIIMLLKQG